MRWLEGQGDGGKGSAARRMENCRRRGRRVLRGVRLGPGWGGAGLGRMRGEARALVAWCNQPTSSLHCLMLMPCQAWTLHCFWHAIENELNGVKCPALQVSPRLA